MVGQLSETEIEFLPQLAHALRVWASARGIDLPGPRRTERYYLRGQLADGVVLGIDVEVRAVGGKGIYDPLRGRGRRVVIVIVRGRIVIVQVHVRNMRIGVGKLHVDRRTVIDSVAIDIDIALRFGSVRQAVVVGVAP